MVTEREQFVADRRKGIGGSDCAAIIGLDPRKTRYQLWREKMGLDGDVSGPAMRRGSFLERAILSRYQATVAPATMDRTVQLVDGWRRCNVDAVAQSNDGTRKVVEAKSVNRNVFRSDWGDPWTDEVPDRALCQGLWYAAIAGVDAIDFPVCVIPDDPDMVLGCTADEVLAVSEFHVFQVRRNPVVEGILLQQATVFWNEYVLAQVPPDAETIEDVNLRWPQTNGNVKPGEPIRALLELYQSECDAKNEHSKAAEKLRERILLYAQDAEAIVAVDGKTPWLTCKTSPRDAYTVQATTTRTLRFTKWWKRLANDPLATSPAPTKQGEKDG